jgi:hypothetical protein
MTTDLFNHQIPSTVSSCISSNVGSITDFLLSSTYSSSTIIPLNNNEQSSEILVHTSVDNHNSKPEDISVRI